MSFYLKVGDVTVVNADTSTGYDVAGHPSFPEPAPDGYGGHLAAERRFSVRCLGTSASAANDKAALLRRECVRDKYLYFRHGASGDVLSCRIREASVTESEYAPGLRDAFGVELAITLSTDPYWLGEWSSETSASASVTAPASHFDVTGVTGEVDALVRLRIVPTTSGTLLAVGVKPDPNSSYVYLDDRSGAALTNALTGSATAKVTASAAAAPVGTAQSINSNHCKGRHLFLCRADCSANSYATTYLKARTTTAGNAIAGTVTVDEQAVAMTASSLVVYDLGDVRIPAGRIPDMETSAAASSATTVSYSGYDASGDWNSTGFPGQTVALTAGDRLDSFTVKTGTGFIMDGTGKCTLYSTSAEGFDTALMIAPYVKITAANTEYSWDFDYVIPTAATYGFGLIALGGLDAPVLLSSSSTYADGSRVNTVSGKTASGDLFFRVTTSVPLGFASTSPVLTYQAAASAGVAVDYVERIPVDFAAIVYSLSSAASLGLYYEGATDTPYAADADGTGPAVYSDCEIRKPLRFKPGVTNRVVIGIGQGDEAIAGVDVLTYAWRPRFLTATG